MEITNPVDSLNSKSIWHIKLLLFVYKMTPRLRFQGNGLLSNGPLKFGNCLTSLFMLQIAQKHAEKTQFTMYCILPTNLNKGAWFDEMKTFGGL